MRVTGLLVCDPRLAPALTWLDSIRGRRIAPMPPCPVPWDVDWAWRWQTRTHVLFDGYGLEVHGDFEPEFVVELVCSLLPLLDHAIGLAVDGRHPRLVHGGMLVFPDGETWCATPAQELKLATMFNGGGT